MSYLFLCHRNLTTLEGITFPEDLIELDISENQLTSLQRCPPNLKILKCSLNKLFIHLISFIYC